MNPNFRTRTIALAVLLASAGFVTASVAQTSHQAAKPATAAPSAAATAPKSVSAVRNLHTEMSPKALRYYEATWGVQLKPIRLVSSGLMIRFSYMVVDANRAKAISDKKFTPVMVDLKSGTRLEVPTLEKVGQLRQATTPENGREYWMLFSNSGTLVRPGDKVDIVIGSFRASGLTVE